MRAYQRTTYRSSRAVHKKEKSKKQGKERKRVQRSFRFMVKDKLLVFVDVVYYQVPGKMRIYS
jgi:hypothetical protein